MKIKSSNREYDVDELRAQWQLARTLITPQAVQLIILRRRERMDVKAIAESLNSTQREISEIMEEALDVLHKNEATSQLVEALDTCWKPDDFTQILT